MELLQIIAKDALHLCFGLYGIGIIYLIASAIKDVIEGLVHWIGNKISKYRTVDSVRK